MNKFSVVQLYGIHLFIESITKSMLSYPCSKYGRLPAGEILIPNVKYKNGLDSRNLFSDTFRKSHSYEFPQCFSFCDVHKVPTFPSLKTSALHCYPRWSGPPVSSLLLSSGWSLTSLLNSWSPQPSLLRITGASLLNMVASSHIWLLKCKLKLN